MASHRKKAIKDYDFLVKKMASTWGLVISAFSLAGMGFGAGCYYSNAINALKKNNIELEYKEKIIDLRSEYETIVDDLRKRIYECEEEKLRNGTAIIK